MYLNVRCRSAEGKMQTVLVTGGAGYIGSAVVHALSERGYRVVVYDDLERGHREAVKGVDLIQGKVGDSSTVSGVLARYGVEAAIHLAASSQVGESMSEPGKYFRNNVEEGIRFFDTLRAHGVRYLVFSSSAAVYGNPDQVPIPEEHPIRPVNPYGETKAMLERVLHWYGTAYGMRSLSLRYFNAAGALPGGEVGEHHTPETHLIPIIMQVALGQREALHVFGTDYDTPDGTAIRDYVHVADLAEAHVLALEALFEGTPSGALNLGTGTGYSVLEVLGAVEAMLNRKLPVVYAPRRAGDPPVLVADPQRSHAVLGWKPTRSDLVSLVRSAWTWHSRHPTGYHG